MMIGIKMKNSVHSLISKIIRPDFKMLIFEFTAVLIFIFLVSLSIISFYHANNMILNSIGNIDMSTLNQINNKIDFSINQITRLADRIKTNDEFKQFCVSLERNTYNTLEKMEFQKKFYTYFDRYLVDYGIIYAVEYTNGKNVLSTLYQKDSILREGIDTEVFKKDLVGKDGNYMILDINKYSRFLNKEYEGIVFMYEIDNGNSGKGALFIFMQPNMIRQLLSEYDNIMIYDKSKDLILLKPYQKTELELIPLIKDFNNNAGNFNAYMGNEQYRVWYTSMNSLNWDVAFLEKVSDISGQIIETRKITIVYAAFILLAGFLIARLLAKKITKPLYELISYVNKYRSSGNADFYPAGKRYFNIRLAIE